jgi:serine/threonine protein kinase
LIRYLRHPGIANEIDEYQDFHPLVMFSDIDEHTARENPFTGNDRFVVYEDGGRPLDIQLDNGWRPSCTVVKSMARQLVEVLAYLFSKKVVHRKLEPGSVVLDAATGHVKLISLGEAKCRPPPRTTIPLLCIKRKRQVH